MGAKEMNYNKLDGLNQNYNDYRGENPDIYMYKFPKNIKFISDGKNW